MAPRLIEITSFHQGEEEIALLRRGVTVSSFSAQGYDSGEDSDDNELCYSDHETSLTEDTEIIPSIPFSDCHSNSQDFSEEEEILNQSEPELNSQDLYRPNRPRRHRRADKQPVSRLKTTIERSYLYPELEIERDIGMALQFLGLALKCGLEAKIVISEDMTFSEYDMVCRSKFPRTMANDDQLQNAGVEKIRKNRRTKSIRSYSSLVPCFH